MFCHQRQSWSEEISLSHITDGLYILSGHEQYQSISSAIPFFICFLRFFPLLFRADIPTRKEGEEVTKTPILHFIIYSFQSTPIKPFSGCYSLSIK